MTTSGTTPTPSDRGVRRRRARGVTALLLAAGCAVTVAGAVVPAGAGVTTLADAGAATGRTIGVAVSAARLTTDPAYAAIVDREYASITPENETAFDALQPTRGTFTFTAAERVVGWAKDHHKQVRGYAPLRGSAQSAWFASLSPTAQREAMTGHLDAVLAHFRGSITTWDVVTEAFGDSGARRPSVLERTGADWIEVAFRAARAADPDARLCYSDYGIEDFASPKAQAVYLMLKDFRARAVPVDCVAIQSHFTGGAKRPESFPTTLRGFASLGLGVELSELEATGDARQPEVFRSVAQDCVAVSACTAITVWGVRDIDSWRGAESPVLFDRDGAPKPAYTAFRAGLLSDWGCFAPVGAGAVAPQCVSQPSTTKPSTTKPSTTKPSTTSPRPSRTKKPSTRCRTRANGTMTCKVVTRR
ncbi:MAG: endo-1,4-beta-xylanase [Kineosporiaceae bacterium]